MATCLLKAIDSNGPTPGLGLRAHAVHVEAMQGRTELLVAVVNEPLVTQVTKHCSRGSRLRKRAYCAWNVCAWPYMQARNRYGAIGGLAYRQPPWLDSIPREAYAQALVALHGWACGAGRAAVQCAVSAAKPAQSAAKPAYPRRSHRQSAAKPADRVTKRSEAGAAPFSVSSHLSVAVAAARCPCGVFAGGGLGTQRCADAAARVSACHGGSRAQHERRQRH